MHKILSHPTRYLIGSSVLSYLQIFNLPICLFYLLSCSPILMLRSNIMGLAFVCWMDSCCNSILSRCIPYSLIGSLFIILFGFTTAISMLGLKLHPTHSSHLLFWNLLFWLVPPFYPKLYLLLNSIYLI